MKSLGLALGGGGLRGIAHIGVLQILEDAGIQVQYLAGTSAGSIIAALSACGISAYEMEEIISKLQTRDYLDYDLGGIFKFVVSVLLPGYRKNLDGIIAGNKLEQLIYKLTGGRSLRDVKPGLAIMACNINTGQLIVFTNSGIDYADEQVVVITDALISEAVRGSTAIPATFQPRHYRGMQMMDGGLKDIVPARAARMMGADYVLAINLGQRIYSESVEGIPEIAARSISILTYETSDTEERIFADMLLFPGVESVKLHELKDAGKIIRAGRRVMKENLDRLIEALNGRA